MMTKPDTALAAPPSESTEAIAPNRALQLDPGQLFAFRGYLYSDEFGDEPRCRVAEALRLVVSQQSGLSNSQIYDRLYADLCGTEPLGHAPLLRFMRLCVAEIKELILRVAESAEVPLSDSPSAKETPQADIVLSPALAAIHPVHTLRRLGAINQVAPSDASLGGMIVHMAVFLGCTDAEIAAMTRASIDDVRTTRRSRFLEVLRLESRPGEHGDFTMNTAP